MLSLLFRYAAFMMAGMSVGGIITGVFPIGPTLLEMAVIVLVVGGLSKIFGLVFGATRLKWANTKKRQIITDLIAFAIGVMALLAEH